MGTFLLILLILVTIYKLYMLSKMCFSYEFFNGTAVLLMMTSIWTLNAVFFIIAIVFGIIGMIIKDNRTKNYNISLGWLFISWLPLLICFFLGLIINSERSPIEVFFHSDYNFVQVISFIAVTYVVYYFYKPIRTPLFILSNLCLIVATACKVASGNIGQDTQSISMDSGDTSSLVPDGGLATAYAASPDVSDVYTATPDFTDSSSIPTMDNINSFDMTNTIPIAGTDLGSNLDTSTPDFTHFNSQIDKIQDMLSGTTVYDPLHMDVAQFNNGSIYDGQQNIVGSYGFDNVTNSYDFYDSSNGLVNSINDKGEFMDASGQIIGTAHNLGGVTTITDNDGNFLYKLNLDGAPVVDDKGNIIGSVSKV